jgi:hypothetical protein
LEAKAYTDLKPNGHHDADQPRTPIARRQAAAERSTP